MVKNSAQCREYAIWDTAQFWGNYLTEFGGVREKQNNIYFKLINTFYSVTKVEGCEAKLPWDTINNFSRPLPQRGPVIARTPFLTP